MNYELSLKTPNSKILTQRGFGLVEIIVASAVIVSSLLGIISFFIFSQSVMLRTIRNTEATALAEQAMEAVRKLRDDGWSANVATLTAGTTYYPTISSNKWTLATTNPAPSSFYTTTVVLSNVNRDSNSNIAATGATDPNTKKAVATVSWRGGAATKTVVLTTYITNFLGN